MTQHPLSQDQDQHQHGSALSFLLDNFCDDLTGISYAIAVSGDGLPLAVSRGVNDAVRDQLGASTAGMMSLTGGMAGFMQAGHVNTVLVELDLGWIIMRKPSQLVVLTVLAHPDADLGQIQHELERLGEAIGRVLSPGARVPS